MSGIFRVARHVALVPILLAGAVALWLSTAPASHAVTATQTQSMQATVVSSIAFGTAGTCTQSVPLMDFGSVGAGGALKTPNVGTLCITSSATPWALSVIGTTPMANGANTIPFTNVQAILQPGGVTPAGGTEGCNSNCPLLNAASLISGDANTGTTTVATTGTGNFIYLLSVPSSQPLGSYTGGVVTFTASA